MGLGLIIDAAARKAAAIPGIKGAWGVGMADDVDALGLDAPPDTPWAVVFPSPGSVEVGMVTLATEALEVRVYVPAATEGAYATLVDFIDAFEVAWRTGTSLGDEGASATYAGYGALSRETWGAVEYLTLPIRISLIRVHHATLTA